MGLWGATLACDLCKLCLLTVLKSNATPLILLTQTANTVLAYFIINGISNCTLGMLNAIVADFAVGREKQEGALTQQYGRLGE